MTATALDYTYKYDFASRINDDRIELATCGGLQASDDFFHARLKQPEVAGQLLALLATVVRTRFHPGKPPDLDPVATSSPAMLRFEGFSGCCGAYVRLDLDERAFAAPAQSFGTTNVDFNVKMQQELVRIRQGNHVELSVSRDRFELKRGDQSVVERKVKLPIRWIKAFGEVQIYQSALMNRLEVTAANFRQFLQAIPSQSRSQMYVVQTGRSLRLSQRSRPNALPIHGPERLKVIEPILRHAKRVLVWLEAESGTTGWQISTDIGSFWYVLSPEMYRGFSGEGQLLAQLASDDWQENVWPVESVLDWQTTIDPAEIAARVGMRIADVSRVLAALGARGLAGFDASTGFYFHRHLPFDLDKVEMLQPRLRNARKLLDARGVRVVETIDEHSWNIEVDGSGTAHFVRLRPDGDRCTCPWFSKNQGARGPCKHILTARMFVDEMKAQ